MPPFVWAKMTPIFHPNFSIVIKGGQATFLWGGGESKLYKWEGGPTYVGKVNYSVSGSVPEMRVEEVKISTPLSRFSFKR